MREDKQGPEVVDVVHVGTHETLQKESKCTHEKLSVREIYDNDESKIRAPRAKPDSVCEFVMLELTLKRCEV